MCINNLTIWRSADNFRINERSGLKYFTFPPLPVFPLNKAVMKYNLFKTMHNLHLLID